jgi:hypothetical protein
MGGRTGTCDSDSLIRVYLQLFWINMPAALVLVNIAMMPESVPRMRPWQYDHHRQATAETAH